MNMRKVSKLWWLLKGEHYYLNLEMPIKKYPMNFGKNNSTHTFFFPHCLPNLFLLGLDVTTLSLGLLSKQGHGRVWAESATRESHSHSQECERVWKMSPHIPKWTSTLGVRVSLEFLNFQKTIWEVRTHWIEDFLISLKNS
jgi:hypothetical protein